MSNDSSPSKFKKGFTIIEMLVIAPIVILTIGAFVTAIVNMTGDVLASRVTNVLTYNIQDALSRIEEDVKQSTSFIAGNNVTITSPQGFDNATGVFTNNDVTNGNMLILNTLATTGNPISTTSGLIYLDDQPNDCTDSLVNQNKPLTINIIYFIKDGTLWRRTVTPSNYETVGCAVPWQQPSCNPSVSNVYCKTQDVRLVDNITTNDFNVQYFNTANATIADTVANDTSKTVAERNTALQSLTTVSASISVNTTAAGRSISQSGTIRATKLDVNASSIAPIIVPVTPAAPTVSRSVSAPVSAVFTWPRVQGATSYSVDYNINGGAWTTGFANQNTTTYTPPACNTASAPCSSHNDVVNVRVTATNVAGTSGYATSSVTIPLWAVPTLQNNWSDFGSTYNTAGYTKTSDGLVVMKGMLKRTGSPIGGEVIATLPPGYRPSGDLVFGTTTNSNVTGRVDVQSDGDVVIQAGSGVFFSLESIRFVPDGPHTRITPTLVNGWTNFGSGFAPASYTYDNNGRVTTQGLVAPGVITNGTRIFDLPANRLPYLYQHISTRSTGFAHISPDNRAGSTGILAKGQGASYLSLNTVFLASASGATWTNLSLVNGWVWYSDSGGIFSTPQYTKTADGLVVLKGLIRSGSTTYDSVIATLPAGFRPRERILTTTSNSGNYSRIDILANGEIHFMGADNGWYSLDSVSFIAEQ